jgi:hypothetical protein
MKTSNKETVVELGPVSRLLQKRDLLFVPVYIALFILICLLNTSISLFRASRFGECRFFRIPVFPSSYVLELSFEESIKENN